MQIQFAARPSILILHSKGVCK